MSGPSVRPARAEAACKVCGAPARPFGALDFNRSCEEPRGVVLPRTGVEVAYLRCEACGLIFTEAFDDWSHADFGTHIYNDRYIEVDPDFATTRPLAEARAIAASFGGAKGEIRLLDYGGGAGLMAATLREQGFDAVTYDPFSEANARRPQGRFNLITCYETLEHMPDPKGGAADIASFMDEECFLIFSTLLQPPDIAELGVGWWYIGPRNGHVTLHSTPSLLRLWEDLGCHLVVFNAANQAAFRTLPPFARRRLPKQLGGDR